MSRFLAAAPGSPPDDWPHYNIGFGAAVKRALRKYATFSGRAGLSEYWLFVLFQLAVFFGFVIVVNLVGYLTSPDGGESYGWPIAPFIALFAIFYLAMIVPTIAITVRRLHDAGLSGWFYLLNFVLPVVVFILTLLATSPVRAAQYGPPPAPNPYLSIPGHYPGGQPPPPLPPYQPPYQPPMS